LDTPLVVWGTPLVLWYVPLAVWGFTDFRPLFPTVVTVTISMYLRNNVIALERTRTTEKQTEQVLILY
jgi:hypothetical protein